MLPPRRVWLRRWASLLLLLPLSYLLRPVLWTPIDQRSYNVLHAQRSVPPWTEVAIVGIDQKSRETVFEPPVFPLSRHVREHARLTRQLDRAQARAIVFDLKLGREMFRRPPLELAEAFAASGKVYLVLSLIERRRVTESGRTRIDLRGQLPDSSLLAASNGAFVADVELDPDGVVRRQRPDDRLGRLGLERLPERLAGFQPHRSVPIIFPSVEQPIPSISYADVLAGGPAALAPLRGRIVFVGLVDDPSTDYVAVPRLQLLGQGDVAFGLPGVAVLAAITETLLRGAPITDAGRLATFGWVLFWSVLTVTVLPRRRPVFSALLLVAVIVLAVLATALLHVRAGFVLPAGFLFGTLFLCGLYTLVSSYVQAARELHAEEVENRQIRVELETARATQERFLPKEIPVVEGFDIWGRNLSSRTVSGDYYDVLDLGGGRPVLLAIADVSGKGLPASLLMSNVQAGLHSHTYLPEFDLEIVVGNLNRLIHENTDPHTFVTLFLAALDRRERMLRYVRAGHDYPLLVRRGGAVERLEEGGVLLGMFPDVSYAVSEVPMHGGDLLCLYTDGVTEARAPGGEEYGVDRLTGILKRRRGESAAEVGRAILESLELFSGKSRHDDDVTLIVLKVEGIDRPA